MSEVSYPIDDLKRKENFNHRFTKHFFFVTEFRVGVFSHQRCLITPRLRANPKGSPELYGKLDPCRRRHSLAAERLYN